MASHGTYGARRIHAELTLVHSIAVGHSCIKLLMRAAGAKGLPGDKRARSKHQIPTVSDLVDRKFTRQEPNKLWVMDLTEHPTRDEKIYCTVVLDPFSGRVAGWSIDSSQTARLVTKALVMAISNRSQTPGTLIHSDHGVQGGFNWSKQHVAVELICRCSSHTSAGVRHWSRSLGRVLRACATAARSSGFHRKRLVPFGKY